jgi:hypothetical protein
MDNRPTIIDVGAQGMDTLAMYLSINAGAGPWASDGGQHGEGITYWVPADASPSGEAAALAAARSIRDYLPGARIVVVANRGASAALGQRIGDLVAQTECLVVPAAPLAVDDIWQSLYAGHGLYGVVRLASDPSAITSVAMGLGISRSRMMVAVRGIQTWALGVLTSIAPIVSAAPTE